MQMVKAILSVLLLLWFALLFFMPKEQLYFKVEERLEKEGVVINESEIEEGLLSLKLKGVQVYLKGAKVADIEALEFFTLIFYSRLDLHHWSAASALKNDIPSEVKEATLSYGLLSPFTLHFDANGSFGDMNGTVDLNERNIALDVNNSKGLEMLRPHLKKAKGGWHYERAY